MHSVYAWLRQYDTYRRRHMLVLLLPGLLLSLLSLRPLRLVRHWPMLLLLMIVALAVRRLTQQWTVANVLWHDRRQLSGWMI
jgi:hypothetical protein